MNLPEIAVLSALGLTAEELAEAVDRGDIEPPFEYPPGEYAWPRRAVVAYLERYGKGPPNSHR